MVICAYTDLQVLDWMVAIVEAPKIAAIAYHILQLRNMQGNQGIPFSCRQQQYCHWQN